MTAEQYWRNLPLHKLRALYDAARERGMSGHWAAEAPHTVWVMGRVLREREALEDGHAVQARD